MTAVADPTPRTTRKPRGPVAAFAHRIYRLLYNKVLGVVVILVMAVATLLGTIVMQMPSGIAQDSLLRAQWLDEVRPRYGGWTTVFDALGFFTLWRSPWFIIITVWLAASIIACTTHRLPNLIQQTLHPRVNVSTRFFERSQYRAEIPVDAAPAQALANTRSLLQGQHYRIVEGKDGSSFYSDKFRWGPWGTVAAHASFVIIILAFVISAAFALDETMKVAIGERQAVGHGTDLEIEVVNFTDSYDEQGRPLDYVSELIAYQGGQKVAEQEVRVNTPLVVDGVRFHQSSFGVAANLNVVSDAGVLFQGSVPLVYRSDDGRFAIGKLVLDEQALELIVVTPASGRVDPTIPAGSTIFELYDLNTDEQLGVVQANYGEQVEIAGTSFTFEREVPYTGLLIRKDPGTIWMWIGSILLIGGMTMTFGMRPRRIWARVDEVDGETVVRLAAAEKPNILFESQFRNLAAAVESANTTQKEPVSC